MCRLDVLALVDFYSWRDYSNQRGPTVLVKPKGFGDPHYMDTPDGGYSQGYY